MGQIYIVKVSLKIQTDHSGTMEPFPVHFSPSKNSFLSTWRRDATASVHYMFNSYFYEYSYKKILNIKHFKLSKPPLISSPLYPPLCIVLAARHNLIQMISPSGKLHILCLAIIPQNQRSFADSCQHRSSYEHVNTLRSSSRRGSQF